MAPDNFKLTKAAALKYQAHSVPAMFEPLARATLAKITMPTAGHIVDVACGTGALTRLIAEKIPGRGKITGTDLNATMIEVAKATQPDTRHEIDWCVADVGNLPFDGGRFDMAFVQQELDRIHVRTVLGDTEADVRPRRQSRASHITDDLLLADGLPYVESVCESRKVPVVGHVAAFVPNLHQIAETARPAVVDHFAAGNRKDRSSGGRRVIDPVVRTRDLEYRVASCCRVA